MKCPNCGGECDRDEVDNGVGMQSCGPWGCPDCGWVEPSINTRDDNDVEQDRQALAEEAADDAYFHTGSRYPGQ